MSIRQQTITNVYIRQQTFNQRLDLGGVCNCTTFPQTPPQNPVNSFFFPAVPVIRITLEEIVVQQVADFEEQVGVDPAAVEDLVGVLAREAELVGEPGDGAPLPAEFLLDEVADVRFFVHCVCLWWSLAR